MLLYSPLLPFTSGASRKFEPHKGVRVKNPCSGGAGFERSGVERSGGAGFERSGAEWSGADRSSSAPLYLFSILRSTAPLQVI